MTTTTMDEWYATDSEGISSTATTAPTGCAPPQFEMSSICSECASPVSAATAVLDERLSSETRSSVEIKSNVNYCPFTNASTNVHLLPPSPPKRNLF